MSERLIGELQRRGVLRDDHVELLRRHQERLGGELDLALLELNLVHEKELLEAMRPAYGLDVAEPEDATRAADLLAVRSFPEQWARKHHLAPLRLELGRRLVLLTAAPPDLELLTRLGEMLDLELVPVLAPAIRVHQRLALLYGIAPSPRVAALLERGGGVGRDSLRPPAPERSSEISSILTADPLTFAEAVSRLRSARDRDEIVQLTLSHARREFDFAALFAVHDDHISGWRGAGEGADNIKNIRIPTGARSAFWMALNTQAHFLGPVTESDREILKGLARGTPRAALMIPLRVRGRSVAVLYVENGPRAIAPRVAAGLMVFATHVQQALENLLLRQKAETSGRGLVGAPEAPLPVPEPVNEEPPPEVPSWVQAIEEATGDITIQTPHAASSPEPLPSPEPALLAPEPVALAPERTPEPVALGPARQSAPAAAARPLHLELIRVAEEETHPAPGVEETERDRLLLEAAARLEAEVSAALETPSGDIHPGDDPTVFAPEAVAELVVAAQVIRRLSSPVASTAASPLEAAVEEQVTTSLHPPELASEPREVAGPLASVDEAARLAMRLDSAPADPSAFTRLSDPPGSEPDMPSPLLAHDEPLEAPIPEPELDTESRPPIVSEGGAPDAAPTLVDLEASTDPNLDLEEIHARLRARQASARAPSQVDAELSPEAWMRASSEITRPRGIRGSISPDADWRAPTPPPGAVSAVGPLPRRVVVSAQPVSPVVEAPAPAVETPSPVAEAPAPSPERVSSPPLPRDPSHAVSSYPPAASSQVRSIPTSPEKTAESEVRSYSLLDLETLLDQLEGPSPDLRRAAREELERVGPSVLPLVGERFPGRVYVDPFARHGRLPPFSECGELLALLTAFGAEAHPFVVGHLDASLPALRFFALYFYQAVHVPEAIPRIVRRIHDEEPRLAMQAVHTLFPYQHEPEFQYVLRHLHERFRTAPPKAKEQTLRLLTLFRDGSAVPTLIEVFERKDKKLYDAVETALAEITKQRFGPNHRRWTQWWEASKNQPRTQWLLAGLDSDDVDLRESALSELRLLAGTDFGFDSHATRRKREAARRRAEQWAMSGAAQSLAGSAP